MWRVKVLLVLGIVAGMLLVPVTALAAFGIDPGKVFIENLSPGTQADVPITIYNHNDEDTTFIVKPRKPDYTAEGYEPLPYLGWITITPNQVTIDAQKTAEVIVVVKMPKDADYSGKKAEAWISFTEGGEGAFVRIELASRLLISTRVEAKKDNQPAPNDEPPPPSVEGSGKVGITAEAQMPEVIPTPPSPPSSSPSPAAIIVPVLGVVLVGGAAFTLIKRKRRA